MWKITVLVHMMAWAVLFGFGTIMITTFRELTEFFGFGLIIPWAIASFIISWLPAHLITKRMIMWRRSPVTGEKKADEPLP